MNRRHFLMSTAAAAGASALKGAPSINDTVRVACVGIRGQGNSHIHEYSKMPNVEIAALCDVDENVLNKRLGEVESSGKKRPAAFTDVRKLLEDKSIDAISIATPNHWHSLHRHLGVPGGQGRVLREAVLAQYFRRRGNWWRRRRSTTASCSTAPTAAPAWPCAKPWTRCARA